MHTHGKTGDLTPQPGDLCGAVVWVKVNNIRTALANTSVLGLNVQASADLPSSACTGTSFRVDLHSQPDLAALSTESGQQTPFLCQFTVSLPAAALTSDTLWLRLNAPCALLKSVNVFTYSTPAIPQ